MYYFIQRTASIVIICYVVQVTSQAFKDSREIGVGRILRTLRDQRETRDSREFINNRKTKEFRESRDQRDDDRERDRDDRGEPEDERNLKERKDSKDLKQSRDPKEPRDSSRENPREETQKKEMTPDVDEFLDKILKSDKIKQIADLIAEKAADKILKQSKSLRSSENKKEKGSDNESSNEKDENPDEFNDDEALKNAKVPKIDAKTAMKKVSKFPDDDLSLNYKHFTAGSVITKGSNNKHRSERQDESIDDDDDSRDESRDKYSKKPDKNLRSDPMFRHGDDKENGEHKRQEKRPLMRSEPELRSGKNRVVKLRAEPDDESFEGVAPITPKQALTENSKEDTESAILANDKDRKMQEPENRFKKEDKASRDITIGNTRSYSSDSDSNKVPIADVHAPDLPSRSMVRKEGQKLFAFASSPDYDEYHEKLSSMLKSVRDKTMRNMKMRPSDK